VSINALHRSAAPRFSFDAPDFSDAGFAASARFRRRSVNSFIWIGRVKDMAIKVVGVTLERHRTTAMSGTPPAGENLN
jgi:hypothetical protein